MGCEDELAGAVAVVGEAGKSRQAGHRQRQRVAVRVGGGNREFEHRVALHGLGGDLSHHGRTVGVTDADRHQNVGGKRQAGTVAIVGGGEMDHIAAGLGIAGHPLEQGRHRVEGGACGQAGHHVADAGVGAFLFRQRPAGQAVLRHEAGIVRIERKRPEGQGLALETDPRTELVEHRRRVHVQDMEAGFGLGAFDAIGNAKLERVVTGLREARGPFEYPGVRIEVRAGGQDVGVERQLLAVRVRGVQLQAQRIAFAQRALGHRLELGRCVVRCNQQAERTRDRGLAVADHQFDVVVGSGGLVVRGPHQGVQQRVEHGAWWQVVGIEMQKVFVHVLGREPDQQRLAFAAFDLRRQFGHQRRVVGPGDCDVEGLGVESAARVVGPQQYGGAGRAGLRGQPAQRTGGTVQLQALWPVQQQVGDDAAVRVAGDSLVTVSAASAGRRYGGGREGRTLVGVRHGIDAVAYADLLGRAVGDANRKAGNRGPGLEHAAGQLARQVDVPQAAGALRTHGARGSALEVTRRVDHQRGRYEQVVVGGVGDRNVVRHHARTPVAAYALELQRHHRGKVLYRHEARDEGGAECHAGAAAHRAQHPQVVQIRLQVAHRQADRARQGVITDARDGGNAAVLSHHLVGLRVEDRGAVGHGAGEHVLVEGDRKRGQRQRRYGQVRRVGGDDTRRDDRADDVDLVRFGHQHTAVGGSHDGFATRTSARYFYRAQGRQVHHGQGRADFTLGGVGRDEQQAFQAGAYLAEGNRVHVCVQTHLDRGTAAAVEGDNVTALRPGGTPQGAIGCKGQVVNPHVAEMPERAFDWVENLDAVARGHIDVAVAGFDRQRLRDTGAGAGQNHACDRVQPEQGAAAGGRPKLAVVVQGQVKDRFVQLHEGRQGTPAVVGNAVEPAPVRAAAGDHGAIGKFKHGQRPDPAMAVNEVGGKGLRREGPLDLGEFRQFRQRRRGRDLFLGLDEQGVGGRGHGSRWGWQILGGLAEARQAAQVGCGAVVWRLHAARGLLAVTRVVGSQGQEFVAVAGPAGIDAKSVGGLAQPDLEVATVLGHVDRYMGHAGAAIFVDRRPAHLVVGPARMHWRGAERCNRGAGVQGLRELLGFLGRNGVETYHGLGRNQRAGRQIVPGLDRVSELSDTAAIGGIGQQQAACGVLHHFAGLRVDGLQHPGSGVGAWVDTSGNAQDEALGVAQVEVALEQRAAGRDVDRDVAELDVAQAEGSRVERRIERAGDADFGDGTRGGGRVLELHRVRQGLAHRQELVHAITLRAGNGR